MMVSDAERDELATLIQGFSREPHRKAANAIIAAGYRKVPAPEEVTVHNTLTMSTRRSREIGYYLVVEHPQLDDPDFQELVKRILNGIHFEQAY
jgi:hypothetical protein